MSELSAEEVAAQIERLVSGEITWRIVGVPWQNYWGNHELVTSDGWEFIVFNDCDEFDYIQSAETPDDRLWVNQFGDRDCAVAGSVYQHYDAMTALLESAQVVPHDAMHGWAP